ncbi:MAG: ornithine carbamoyltransferase [Candidatus Omnitrophica bacterium]|nr:ornithine carbamoyltransferase [Candidatus Omnitrophota bacterium]
MKEDFLSIANLTKEEISQIFQKAALLKKKPLSMSQTLKNKIIGLIFQKPSNRTRVSFEVGSIQMGASPIYLGPDDIKFGERESIKDIAKVLSRYLNLAVLRTFNHSDILEFAKYATIPVVNGLSDLFHPCQALSDIFTIKEKLTEIKGKTLCFVGDGNNVLHSLLYCCSKLGINMKIATPNGYKPSNKILQSAMTIAKKTGSSIELGDDPQKATKGADIIYTDVWVSMGQEKQKFIREKAFKGFQVNAKLISLAKKNALVMHCLPAHRGEEITDDVIESKNSVVFDQAENRLHVQKAIMLKLLAS